MHKHTIFCLLSGIGLTVFAPWAAAEDAARPEPQTKITIGKETSYITEPLTDDGYPDYAAAMNETFGRGVTLENNAAVLLQKIFGPGDIPQELRENYFKQLGIKPLPESGTYFTSSSEIVKRYRASHRLNEDQIEILDDQFEQARQRPWRAGDFPVVAKWLQANQNLLPQVVEESKRERMFFPVLLKPKTLLIAIGLPHGPQLRQAAEALQADAMRLVGEGKPSRAWQELLACHRLARLVAQGKTLVEVLYGYTIEDNTVRADLALLHYGKPTTAEIAKMRADLKLLPAFPDLVQVFDRSERFIYLDAAMHAARDGIEDLANLNRAASGTSKTDFKKTIGDSVIDWNIAMRLGNPWYDRLVSMSKLPTFREQRDASDRFTHDLGKLSADIKSPGKLAWDFFTKLSATEIISSRVGETFVALFLPATQAVLTSRALMDANGAMLQTALALAAYRAEHKQYPEKLEQLVPKYLEKILDDVFALEAGKPLHYRREGEAYLLWSVGNNGQDDNGNSYQDESPGDDWAFRPVAAKKSGSAEAK